MMTNENTNLKELPDYLDELELDYEDGIIDTVENTISQKMPGYHIYTWDADEQGTIEFAEEYTSIIGKHIKDNITDIQFSEWSTQDNELFLIVIAIKTEK